MDYLVTGGHREQEGKLATIRVENLWGDNSVICPTLLIHSESSPRDPAELHY